MEEATTYLGASSRHAYCENYKFQPNTALKMFKKDEIFNDIQWLDVQNCTGILDQSTFKNLPKLEILNLRHCNFEKIEDNTLAMLKNLKSMDIKKTTFPFTKNTFEKCENLHNLRFIKLANEVTDTSSLKHIKNLEYLMFHDISGLKFTNDMFLGLENLKYLFITKCMIENFNENIFGNLKNLEAIYFHGNSLENFDTTAFLKLTSLKVLALYDNTEKNSEKLNTDYEILKKLPNLETISFPEEDLKKLDFEDFTKLKKVELVIEQHTDDMYQLLKERNINVEWTTTIDLSQEIDFKAKNIQICA